MQRFIAEEGVEEIIRQKEDGGYKLIGRKCRDCGFIIFPALKTCVKCKSAATEAVELAEEGTLYTYTRTMRPVNHMPADNVTGYIDLDDGCRVLAPIDMPDGKDPVIGTRMKTGFRTLWTEEDGTEVLGFAFSPAEEVQ